MQTQSPSQSKRFPLGNGRRGSVHLGLDVDGVLRDMAGQLVRVFDREFPALAGKSLPIPQWPQWGGFHRYFPEGIDLYAMSRRCRKDIWLDAPAYPGVPEVIDGLSKRFTLHIVTHQPSELTAALTREWLVRHGVKIPPERIHITADKASVAVDVLVDDMIHNLEAVRAAGRVAVCREQPWNRDWSGPRIAALEELEPLLDDLIRSSGGRIP